MRRPDARALLYERIRKTPPKFVHVTGVPYTVEPAPSAAPEESDHLWVTMEVPPFGRLRALLNTTSRVCGAAGADARIRVGIVPGRWEEKPQTGLVECDGMNYAAVEATFPVEYETMEQPELMELLVGKLKKAIRMELWGDLCAREQLGIHQIHCRRASAGVSVDVIGRDGALKLYFAEDNRTELLLFKFTGQP